MFYSKICYSNVQCLAILFRKYAIRKREVLIEIDIQRKRIQFQVTKLQVIFHCQDKEANDKTNCKARQNNLYQLLLQNIMIHCLLDPSIIFLASLFLLFGLIQVPNTFHYENDKWNKQAKYQPIINQFHVCSFRNGQRYALVEGVHY